MSINLNISSHNSTITTSVTSIKERQMAIIEAAEEGNTEAIRTLLNNEPIENRSSLVDFQDTEGMTPLMCAAANNRTEVVQVLIDNNALIDLQDSFGSTALMWASVKGHFSIAELLVTNGASLDLKDNEEWTALVWAVILGHIDITELLLKNGAEPDIQDNEGLTALMKAVATNRIDIVTLLLNNNASPNIQDNEKWTALTLAANNGYFDIIKCLSESGASPNKVTASGKNALMLVKYMYPLQYKETKKLFYKKNYKLEKCNEFIKWVKLICHSHHIQGKSTYTHGHKTFSFPREGMAGNYFSKNMLKNWAAFNKQFPELISKVLQEKISSVLKTHICSETMADADIAKIYLETKSVAISTGFTDHRVIELIWNGYDIWSNRGATSKKAVSIHQIQKEEIENSDFLTNRFATVRKLSTSTKEDYKKFILSEESKPYRIKQGKLERLLEQELKLELQSVGNCSWTSLEQMLWTVFALEILKSKELLNPEKIEEIKIKKEISEAKVLFQQFMEYQKKAHVTGYLSCTSKNIALREKTIMDRITPNLLT